MACLDAKIKKRLADKLVRLNALRPLPAAAVCKLRGQFSLEMAYNSNAIEGNSLTLKETHLVINEGLTIKGKPLKDHLEAKNHQAALEYLYELADGRRRATLSENLIRSLNQLVVGELDREWAGRYRQSAVLIGGADHTPPDALAVPALMRRLVVWLRRNQKRLHPVELAGELHHRLVHIHPFFDGNGRTARLVMNIILLRAGFPLAVILKHDRKKYYLTLALADQGDICPFVRFLAQSVERSLDIYLKILTPARVKSEKFVRLSRLAKTQGLSEKHLNLLARQGKLEAHKEGRLWLASNEAMNRYLAGRARQK